MKRITLFLLTILTFNIGAQSLEWIKSMGGPDTDFGLAIDVDADDNVYTVGFFNETIDFNPNEGTTNLTTNGNEDIFIQKLDAEGNLLWAKNIGGDFADKGNDLTLDTLDNIYITGYFSGTSDFDPSEGVSLLFSEGGIDAFILKLDTNGNFFWAKNMGGYGIDIGRSIRVDNDGNIYSIGTFEETVNFDPNEGFTILSAVGDYDIYIQKLDTNGQILWAKSIGGLGWDLGSSIALDAVGNVYATGFFSETADFDPNDGVMNLISEGDKDVFILKLNTDGQFVWAKKIGSTKWDSANFIALDGSDNVYIVGRFKETVNFNPNGGEPFNLTEVGRTDFFTLKLDQDGQFIWANSIGGTGYDAGKVIEIDDAGNVFTAGWFEETVDFDPGEGTYFLTSVARRDLFVQKLDPEGNFEWAINVGGGEVNVATDMALDHSNHVYTTGYFQGTADFDPGEAVSDHTSAGDIDIFILKLDAEIFVKAENIYPSVIKLYPNPNNGVFYIDLPESTQNARISVIDNLGKFVYKANLNQPTSKLNLSHLPAGIYRLSMLLKTGARFYGDVIVE